MKIKFIEAPKGRDYKVGDIVEFKGLISEGYAQKYINRGWAIEVADEKPSKKAEPAPPKAEAQRPEVVVETAKPGGLAPRIIG